MPINKALIKSQEHNISTFTDEGGAFELEVTPGEELAISADGYETKYVKASQDELKEINLVSIDHPGEEDVQVLFRTKKQKDLLGDVSFVDIEKLIQKNYFTYSLDGMEAYVPGYNGNSMWAKGSYLTLVDGVPRDANNVLPTEIDQISFLKGVNAVALYGSRAAKGIILITTKRGEANNRRVDIRADVGAFTPVSYPKYLGAAEYMTLYNEARTNDGLSPLYNEATIYRTAAKTNPYRYPDVDFYSSDYLKQMYNRYDATAEISGGNDKARYYTNVGFYTVGSLLNFGRAQENNRTGRFNVRGNVDIDLNDYITGKIDASATFYNGKGVNADYWGAASTVRPNRFAPLVPISMIDSADEASLLYVKNSNNIIDGKYLLGGTQLDQTNAFASVYAGGYNQYISRQFQFDAGVGADLRNVLQGLKFQTNFAVDYATAYSLAYNYTYAAYQPLWNNFSGEDRISSLMKYGLDATSGTQNVSNSWYRQTIALSGGFAYENVFGGAHKITGLLMANGYQQSESAVYHRVSNSNLGLQLGYNFRDKYYADFSSAYVHSAKLPAGKRGAFSPTLSLAWRISKEDFIQNASSVIDDLKVTASAGLLNTDLDITNYYMYQGYYTVAGSWYGWKDGTGFQATESRLGNNPDMTFPKIKEINAGFEGSFFKKLLHLSGSFFVNKIEGNLIQASVLFPSYFNTGWPVSSFIPYVNYNNDKRTGVDFGIGLNKNLGEMNVNFGVNGTYYTTKATKRAELYADQYQYRQGRALDGIWGLESMGFYSSQDNIIIHLFHLSGRFTPAI